MLFVCAVAVAACGGDDGVHHLADAPVAPDGAIDAPADAPVDVGIDGPPMLTTMPVQPTGLGGLCAVAFDAADSEVLVYPCSGATIHRRSTAGADLGTIARPGEAADDVDLEVAPVAFTLGTTAVAAGALLFANGETDVTELYTPETSATAALVTQFGASHVVGVAVHPTRGTLFLSQDRNGATNPSTIAEINPTTGAVVAMFPTTPQFTINYGDIDVCGSSGNLFVVSNVERTIAEFTPAGVFVNAYALPAQVGGASGIALEGDAAGSAWISDTGGGLWRLSGLPCAP
jgi:hypothetical protein